MKTKKLLISIVIVSLLVSMAIPMASAPKPDKPGGGKPPKDEPPADPAIAYMKFGVKDKLMVMNADGTNQVEIYSVQDLSGTLSWSPDGNAITFLVGSIQMDLWRIDISVVDGVPQGSNPYMLTQDVYYNPAWSPLGDEIAFTKYLNGAPRLIQTISAIGGTIETIYTAPEGHWITDPAWRSDGLKLAFVENYNNQKSVVVLDFSDSSTTTVYGPHNGAIFHIDWARTKDVLTFIRGESGSTAVVTLDITEESPTPQVVYEGSCRTPSWSPDDSKLVFERPVYSKGGSVKYAAIFVYEFSTGDFTELARGVKPDWCRA